MSGIVTDPAGRGPSNPSGLAPRRHMASLQLLAGAALVISTVVAMTVVSIGIARAGTVGASWHAVNGGPLPLVTAGAAAHNPR